MAGIVSYGSYIPYRRLKRAAIAAVLGVAPGRGEKAVASFDEDSVSMSTEALRDALKGAPAVTPTALFFATTTPPYAEKLNAAIIGAAARLPIELRAADLTGSMRAGIGGILQAADAAKSGGGPAALAVADSRLGAPEGRVEQQGGDGAAAFILGVDHVLAEIEASASFTREFLDTWRNPDERFAHSWEERFALTQAYGPLFEKVVTAVLEKAAIKPGDLAKVILDAPNPRAADEFLRVMK